MLAGALLLAGLAIGSQHEPKPPAAHDAHVREHWTYYGVEGPAHWGMLSPAYMTCEAGSRQSPIDIHMPQHGAGQEHLVFEYKPARVQLVNNGHTVQVNYEPGSTLRLNGTSYALRQFHFHEPSEHRVEGRRYAMELHLVHQNAAAHVAVVAVLMDSGAENTVLARLWPNLPRHAGQVSADVVVDAHDLVPATFHHYSYEGSLTTPPCTEGVRWIVLKEPIQVSAEQLQAFVGIIGHDARPTQPLNARSVKEF